MPTCELEAGGQLQQMSDDQIQTQEPERQTASKEACNEDDEPCIVEEVTNVNIISGRLQYFINAWREITDDNFILSCIKGYSIPFKDHPIQSKSLNQPSWSSEQRTEIRSAIAQLLIKKAVEEYLESNNQFISSVFLVPKPDGSSRFIINLKELNKLIDPKHFKMEDIRSARDLIGKNDYMCTLDLKDAYYLVPVKKNHRKFLRFYFEKKVYQFNCLPFGLCTSPYIFTKIMKPIVNHLRLAILCIIYLDDILIVENLLEKCKTNVEKAISLLERLGFIINYKKSSLVPSQKCKYLGFIINSMDFCLELDDKKKLKISSLLKNFHEGKWYKIRKFAQLLGTLNAACPAINV